MILLLWIPIWILILGSLIIQKNNYYYSYSIPFYYMFILFILFGITLVAFSIKVKINDFRGNPINRMLKITFALLLSFIFSVITKNGLSNIYISYFGKEISYIAEVYNKRIVHQRDKIHHYINIKSDVIDATLDYAPLYLKVDIGSKIMVKQNISDIGYYIKYSDVELLNK